jgi:hypothetical protein
MLALSWVVRRINSNLRHINLDGLGRRSLIVDQAGAIPALHLLSDILGSGYCWGSRCSRHGEVSNLGLQALERLRGRFVGFEFSEIEFLNKI